MLSSSLSTVNPKMADIMKIYSFMAKKPSRISAKHMERLLKLRKRTHVMSFLTKLREKEDRNCSFKISSLKRRLLRKNSLLFDPETGQPLYGAPFLSLLTPDISEHHLSLTQSARMLDAHFSGASKVVIDFDYYEYMPISNYHVLGTEILKLYHVLALSENPLALHFCNYRLEEPGISLLSKKLQSVGHLIADITSESYLKKFPTERLVYLSPYAKDTLSFDPNDIYILGAMIDGSKEIQVSHLKAHAEGIRTASIPFAQFFNLRNRRRSFHMRTIVSILCDLHQNGGDLAAALERFPITRILTQQRFEEEGLMTS